MCNAMLGLDGLGEQGRDGKGSCRAAGRSARDGNLFSFASRWSFPARGGIGGLRLPGEGRELPAGSPGCGREGERDRERGREGLARRLAGDRCECAGRNSAI